MAFSRESKYKRSPESTQPHNKNRDSYTIHNLSNPDLQSKAISFIHSIFPIKYPESWILDLLNHKNTVHFAVVTRENEIVSIIVARIFSKNEVDQEITIPDLVERIGKKNICYWGLGIEEVRNYFTAVNLFLFWPKKNIRKRNRKDF